MQAPIVCVVDEDSSVRESLEALIQCEGWRPALFACAHDFLADAGPSVPSCLVVDVGLADLDDLARRGVPFICVTGHCDVPLAVRAMKAGALELLMKPLDADVLRTAIRSAIELSATAHDQELQHQALRTAYASLSTREREVMQLVVTGMLNKQIGDALGISEITVKAHRGKVMRKMHAASLADLVRMDAKLQSAR